MTVHTGDRRVGRIQDEIGTPGVIENADSPRFAAMTVFAFGTVMAFVIVILEMAADAVHLHDIIKRVFAMTVTAGQHPVLAFEWEFGVPRVIETRVCP